MEASGDVLAYATSLADLGSFKNSMAGSTVTHALAQGTPCREAAETAPYQWFAPFPAKTKGVDRSECPNP